MFFKGNLRRKEAFNINDYEYNEFGDIGQILVHPNYIGNSFQKELINFIEKKMINSGYKKSIATVHEDNIYSLNNLKKCNYCVITKMQFDWGERLLVSKKLK